MCTVGCLIERGRTLTFKQCDLALPTRFCEPAMRVGGRGTRYVSFEREGAGGPWAGVNERGVAFVAADAYLDRALARSIDPGGDLLQGYARILADHARAEDAVEDMIALYEARGTPDILLVSDPTRAYVLEYSPIAGAAVTEVVSGHIVSTNHYRTLPGAIAFEDDPSSHLRLARAVEILDADPSLDGIRALLLDQHFGESECSICRVAETPGEHYTQATVIFGVSPESVDCVYVLNGNPRTGHAVEWGDVFGTGAPPTSE